MGLYYEEWEIGKEYRSPSVTVTEAHVVQYCSLTQINDPIYTDEQYCKKTPYGRRIAPPLLVSSLGGGVMGRLMLNDGTTVGDLGLENLQYPNPVFIGDTITTIRTILDKRETKNPERGLVRYRTTVVNQRGEEVATQEVLMLFRKKPQGS